MKKHVITLLLFCHSAQSAMFVDNKKQDYDAFSQPQMLQASAVGAVVSETKNGFNRLSANEWSMKIIKITDKKGKKNPLNLCEGELFSSEMRGDTVKSWGVLIGKQHFMLAGHSMDSPTDCEKKKIVFGFNGQAINGISTELIIDDKNVYGCEKIEFLRYDGNVNTRPSDLRFEQDAGMIDVAVIKLNKPVEHIAPAKIDFNLEPLELEQELFLIAGFMGTPFFGEKSSIKSQISDFSLIGLNSTSTVGTSGGSYFDENGFLRAVHIASSFGTDWSTTLIDDANMCKRWIKTSNTQANFSEPIFSEKRNIWMPSYSSAMNLKLLEPYISDFVGH